jgi:threonyl-tRNA synthetase
VSESVTVYVEGRAVTVPAGTRLADLVPEDARATVLAAAVDGRPTDLTRPVVPASHVTWLTFEDSAGRHVFRHSGAHLLAQAVKRLWPTAELGTGPALEDGFYYDVRVPEPITEADLPRIQAVMETIVREDWPVERQELSRDEARRLFEERGERLKLEIIDQIPDGTPITAYRQGEFVDLCVGPHVPRTGRLGAVALTSVSGAYWRGDERRPMLTRIYGTAFPTRDQLDAHLARLEEARRRDHRKLGRDLGLYLFRDEAPGFAFWEPNGVRLYRTLEELSRALQEPLGYEEIMTPWIYRSALWKTSGHWQHYRDNMFLVSEGDDELGVKPMNCPGHCVLFASEVRSYRDLPLKWADYSPLSRYERSGTLHGLMRARGFHQDDAHLFVRPSQIGEQVAEVMALVDKVYHLFDMTVEVQFSTRPDDYLGDLATWDHAEAQLKAALDASGKPYGIQPGEGAFYGPKLDFFAIDALGRKWQTATVQLDFQMPQQFDLVYTEQDGSRQRPVMIHRAVFGSLERFIGILVEHYGGAFPMWLAPEQVRVLPVTDAEEPYAARIVGDLKRIGLRARVDARREKLGWRIRSGQLDKIPVLLVVGGREAETKTVAVRTRAGGDQGTRPWPAYASELLALAEPPAVG